MKIFTINQIVEADKYTIANEPISSLNLMKRASETFFDKLLDNIMYDSKIHVFCGSGNNGGDGLKVANILSVYNYKVTAWYIKSENKPSKDNEIQFNKLIKNNKNILKTIENENEIDIIDDEKNVIIDAIFGSGLNRKIDGEIATIINKLNNVYGLKISIDIPSGLFADKYSDKQNTIFKAHYTYTFQFPKLSFFFKENEQFCGHWEVLPIGIHEDYISKAETQNYFTTIYEIKNLYKQRKIFSHKGTYGHGLLIAGKYGMAGASLLAAKSCIKTGIGLLTTHIPKCNYQIIQNYVPEVILSIDNSENHFSNIDWKELQKFNAVAIGPGIGNNAETANSLKLLIQNCSSPLIIDADGLNILSENKTWLSFLPANTILTPHPKEFERLFGKTTNGFEQIELLKEVCIKYNIIVVLKGAFTAVCNSKGEVFFNSTGNSGLATAGTGDVLTGIILSLLAQGYNTQNASILGVFVHGLAADIAIDEDENETVETLTATDMIEYLGRSFKKIANNLL